VAEAETSAAVPAARALVAATAVDPVVPAVLAAGRVVRVPAVGLAVRARAASAARVGVPVAPAVAVVVPVVVRVGVPVVSVVRAEARVAAAVPAVRPNGDGRSVVATAPSSNRRRSG
jgi:hypothetical protein